MASRFPMATRQLSAGSGPLPWSRRINAARRGVFAPRDQSGASALGQFRHDGRMGLDEDKLPRGAASARTRPPSPRQTAPGLAEEKSRNDPSHHPTEFETRELSNWPPLIAIHPLRHPERHEVLNRAAVPRVPLGSPSRGRTKPRPETGRPARREKLPGSMARYGTAAKRLLRAPPSLPGPGRRRAAPARGRHP